MNSDYFKDLIDRLIHDERSKSIVWTHDESRLEFDGDILEQDAHSSIVSFRIQRLAKSNERRAFLIECIRKNGNEGDADRNYLNSDDDCVCQQQLSYSACLRMVNEKQERLSWVDGTKKDDGGDEKIEKMQPFTDLVRHVADRLLQCPLVSLHDSDHQRILDAVQSQFAAHTERKPERHPNLVIPDLILETESNFYAVTFSDDSNDWVTLWDAAVFHPYVLTEDADRLLFIVYQLISTLAHCHKTAHYLITDLRLDCVRINSQDFWCRLDVWRCLQYASKWLIERKDDAVEMVLGDWCDRWTRGLVSNFEYLNILNEFAGRRTGDPYYHPIFPWVCDFTRDPLSAAVREDEVKSENGWRDLSKTKFRLTKGDQQLDQTFAGQMGGGGGATSASSTRSPSISCQASTVGGGSTGLPPHHVTEFLSDIGYYSYKSRRTAKSILCRHVRHRWVPEEYPSSIRRQYEWTPDEAIPEFYSDPDIFVSIHEDLADLELPPWLMTDDGRKKLGERFVEWHRRVLESDRVSERLHAWIDLVFGYQLTGQPAERAKNVQLRLVERADRLSNNGVVQLFTKPHPRRQIKNKSSSASRATMDEVMNPLYDMENLQTISVENETRSAERSSASPFPNEIWNDIQTCQVSQKTSPLIRECLTSLGVFLTELCHSDVFRQLPRYVSAQQRLQVAKRAVFNGQTSPLPRCIRFSVEILLNSNLLVTPDNLIVSSTPAVDSSLLSPGLLLQPLICLVPFPYYLAPLYDCFRRVRSLELESTAINTDSILKSSNGSSSSDWRSIMDLAERRVRDVAKLLPLILPHTPVAGVEILARLIKRSMLTDPFTRVLATWSLWNPLTQALGPSLTEKHLLDELIDLYDVDQPCSTKFLKLYHRTFLLQLSVRLGVERFLDNLVQPLVEAAAGERDDRFYEDDQEYWTRVLDSCGRRRRGDCGEVEEASVVRRHHLFSTINRDSMTIMGSSTIESPAAGRRNSRGAKSTEDEAEVMVQFQLEMADEGLQQHHLDQHDSISNTDVDAILTPIDAISIRSSESGFSVGVGGLSSSLSVSKMEQDENEYARIKSRQQSSSTNQQQQSALSVSEVAEESLLWLAHRLGPLLTTRYLTKNLLRMLALCYSTDRLVPMSLSTTSTTNVDDDSPPPALTEFTSSWYPVFGDTGAAKVLHCLEEIATIYGEHMILRHYFTYAGELIAQALRRLTPNTEMAVLSCVALIRRTFPYLTHEQMMENLKDHTFIDTLLFPLIRAASSIKVTFSNTATRTTLTWKLAECLYWLGVRVGAENVKTYLLVLVQRLFCTYDILYELDTRTNRIVEIAGMSTSRKGTIAAEWSDAAFVQLKATFTPVLAARMLKAFGSLCGRQYLQLSLSNGDLLTRLCADADSTSGDGGIGETGGGGSAELGASVGSFRLPPGSIGGGGGENSTIIVDHAAEVDLVCKRLKHSSRKLKGNWLAYWEYELGRHPKESHFNFKHMKLQTFGGHSGLVRKILPLDNENSFFSISQDKTVKLWSLRSTGDGGARTSCQFTYKSHKRALWDLAFVESVRLVASVDGSVHLWDPFMGVPIREFDFGDPSNDQQAQQQVQAATIVEACTAPSSALLVAGTLPVIRFLDVRQAKWAHEFSLGVQRQQGGAGIGGPIRAVCVDPSGADRWVAVGHGLGHVSTLDMRTGRLLGQTRVCETDIFAMSAYDKEQFVVCPFDHPLCLVRARDCTIRCRVPGSSDSVTCMSRYYGELICSTQSNRLRLYSSMAPDATFADSKLRADMFAGAVSTIRVLPLNKLLLLGSSTGSIELLC